MVKLHSSIFSKTCTVCKNPFVVVGSRNKKRKTCSRICANKSRGSGNPKRAFGKCQASSCDYDGPLEIQKYCRKHFAYFLRHGIPESVARTPVPLKIPEAWKMWLAAVIDCEGWIGVMKTRRNNGAAYWGAIGVGNTNCILTETLKSLTGLGTCRINKRKYPAKDMMQWTVTKRSEVDDLLITIFPYLLLKQQQAELVLSLPKLHARETAARAEIKHKLATLNKKGVAHSLLRKS